MRRWRRRRRRKRKTSSPARRPRSVSPWPRRNGLFISLSFSFAPPLSLSLSVCLSVCPSREDPSLKSRRSRLVGTLRRGREDVRKRRGALSLSSHSALARSSLLISAGETPRAVSLSRHAKFSAARRRSSRRGVSRRAAPRSIRAGSCPLVAPACTSIFLSRSLPSSPRPYLRVSSCDSVFLCFLHFFPPVCVCDSLRSATIRAALERFRGLASRV